MELVDNSGREVAVVLLARSESHIEFRRVSDDQMFEFPIADLAQKSRSEVLRLPVTTSRPKSEAEAAMEHPYITEKKELIERAQIKIQELIMEAEAPGISEAKQRSILREIGQLQTKIGAYERDIQRYLEDFGLSPVGNEP